MTQISLKQALRMASASQRAALLWSAPISTGGQRERNPHWILKQTGVRFDANVEAGRLRVVA